MRQSGICSGPLLHKLWLMLRVDLNGTLVIDSWRSCGYFLTGRFGVTPGSLFSMLRTLIKRKSSAARSTRSGPPTPKPIPNCSNHSDATGPFGMGNGVHLCGACWRASDHYRDMMRDSDLRLASELRDMTEIGDDEIA